MIDQKVWQVQDWLNSTYGKHAQWRPLVVDGLIGWNTIFGLIRGLQVELGISTLSDAFGDTTFSRLTSQYPRISSSTGNANIKRLAQSALWCQGYLGGNTWGTYDAVLNSGLKKFSFNLGLTAEGQSVSTVFTPKMVKALMTLDSYVLLQNGSAEVREAQRWINGTYRSRKMPFLPCDGIFTRSTQQGLVTAIQYELGMTDAQANGNFGSGTKSGLATNAVVALGATDTSKNWVHLLQCALRMNGYTTPLSGTFDATTEQSVGKFKSFAELSGGAKADFPTWASLLISTGDELRKGVASDMSTPLSAQYCSALASAGYKTVGRYLSVNGKRYQPGELARIFAAGLATFPIMQEDNTYAEYFDADRGKDHAFQAIRRLRQLGFKAGATVFFAVDFDASDDTITSRIIPYFRAVAARLEKSIVSYKIGVYGTRNVCARIVDEGLAAEGFIASMSWGWGGNLGYALPPKWSYDQIRNHALDGTDLEIDTNVQSSRAKPATSGDVLPTPLAQVFVPTPGTNFDENYFWYVTELSVRAENLIKPTGSTANWSDRANRLALLYLAQLEYNDAKWAAYAPIDLQGTIELSALTSLRQEIDEPSSSTRGRLAHMAAATRGYRTWGVPAGDSTAQIADAGGWGLDLAQAWKELKDAGQTSNIRAWAKKYIGNSSRYFGSEDLIADVDAYLIASALKSNPNMTLDEVVRQIEVASQSDSRWRFRKFINDRFGGSLSKAATAAASVYQDGILRELAGLVSDTEPPTEAQGTQLGLGFSDALRAKAGL